MRYLFDDESDLFRNARPCELHNEVPCATCHRVEGQCDWGHCTDGHEVVIRDGRSMRLVCNRHGEALVSFHGASYHEEDQQS